jgi:hypothetical protein
VSLEILLLLLLCTLDGTILALYAVFMWLLSDEMRVAYRKKRAARAGAKYSSSLPAPPTEEVPTFDDGPSG